MVNKKVAKEVLALRDDYFTRDAIAVMTGLTPEQVKHICSGKFKGELDEPEPTRETSYLTSKIDKQNKKVLDKCCPTEAKEVKIFPTSPIGRLKKAEIVWLANHKCKHSHSYLEHYPCYLKEVKPDSKIGFLDIEASNLKADFGIMLCYCIKEAGTDTILSSTITASDLRTCLDEKVVRQCIIDMQKFDRLVTYFGSGFDLPFIRTRALSMDIDFPGFGDIIHTDIYFTARAKLCLSSKRLENVSRVILGETEKTRIDSKHWIKALQGDVEALDYILDHCERDVRDLERVYDKLIGFKKRSDASI